MDIAVKAVTQDILLHQVIQATQESVAIQVLVHQDIVGILERAILARQVSVV